MLYLRKALPPGNLIFCQKLQVQLRNLLALGEPFLSFSVYTTNIRGSAILILSMGALEVYTLYGICEFKETWEHGLLEILSTEILHEVAT